jgi:hypothetical protein
VVCVRAEGRFEIEMGQEGEGGSRCGVAWEGAVRQPCASS